MNSQVMYHNVPTPPGNVSLAAAAPDGGLLYAVFMLAKYRVFQWTQTQKRMLAKITFITEG